MFLSRCNCYVTFLVAKNTLSNSFKYPHARKSQNWFGSTNMKSFYGNGVSFNPILGLLTNGEAERPSLLKISHTYPTIMKLAKFIPYLKKIQKIYKSCDILLEVC